MTKKQQREAQRMKYYAALAPFLYEVQRIIGRPEWGYVYKLDGCVIQRSPIQPQFRAIRDWERVAYLGWSKAVLIKASKALSTKMFSEAAERKCIIACNEMELEMTHALYV